MNNITVACQKEYNGREKSCILQETSLKNRVKPEVADVLVGTVEWVEQFIGPHYQEYPEWTKPWYRTIEKKNAFIKPTKYKGFNAFLDQVYIIEPVKFVDEWRHYVADGVDLCSWWYDGNEETCDNDPNGPPLPFEVPKDYCGAIDIGVLDTGQVTMVECHHPYAIGWYGDISDNKLYLEFLHKGFKSLRRNRCD